MARIRGFSKSTKEWEKLRTMVVFKVGLSDSSDQNSRQLKIVVKNDPQSYK
jgi:hypothetical protein